MNDREWMQEGEGSPPILSWSFTTDAPLLTLQLARETGETLAADESGGLYRLNREGQVLSVTRGIHCSGPLAWSDRGNGGLAVVNRYHLVRFDRSLKVEWSLELSCEILAVAMDPSGTYFAVSLENLETWLLREDQKRMASIKTFQPLDGMEFLVRSPEFVGLASLGSLSLFSIKGQEQWRESLSFRTGGLTMTGNGERIVVAGHQFGILVYGHNGEKRASFQVQGTPTQVCTGFTPKRLAVSTIENHLYWLDYNGQLYWGSLAPEPICQIKSDPLHHWMVCGFSSGRIVRFTFLELF